MRPPVGLWLAAGAAGLAALLAGCGPTPQQVGATGTEEAARMAATQTAAVPTATRTPVPSATSTQTPTSTPTPKPDASAMIAWQDIGLTEGFVAQPPESLGVQVGEPALTVGIGDRRLSANIAGSHVFVDAGSGETVFSFAFALPTASDREIFDTVLDVFMDFLGSGGFYTEVLVLPDIGPVGDYSAAGAGSFQDDRGLRWRDERIGFRVGNVGALVFVRHHESSPPLVSVESLARVYAMSIQERLHTCRMISIEPAAGVSWPTFNYVAEGFYPGEGREFYMNAEVAIGGNKQEVMSSALGLTADAPTADREGIIRDKAAFGAIAGEGVVPPDQIDFKLRGKASGCEVTRTLEWPGG